MRTFAFPAAMLLAVCLAPMAAAAPVPKATKESPEVEAYLKARGWKIVREIHWPSTESHVTLSVVAPQPVWGFNPAKVEVDGECYKMLAELQTVEFLDLQYTDCTDAGLQIVLDNRAIMRVNVGGKALTDGGLKKLGGARWLRHVSIISAPKITEAGVRELSKLPYLKALELHDLAVTGTCFEAFAEAAALTTLIIKSDCTTDEGAGRIAKLPSLSKLSITRGGKMTAAGVKVIAATHLPAVFNFDSRLLDDELLKTLVSKGHYDTFTIQSLAATKPKGVRHILLVDCAVTDKGFEVLLDCTETVTISVYNTPITDASLLKMGGFKKLRRISLHGSRVTGTGLAVLTESPIHTLDWEASPISEDSFKAIGRMAKLSSLHIADSTFDPDWVKHLSSAKSLNSLAAQNTGFDDASAKSLAGMPNLYHLDLQSTKLTDKGFADLLKLPKLDCLNIERSLVTKEAFIRAKKEYPKVTLSNPEFQR